MKAKLLVLTMVAAALAAGVLCAQTADLTGTWVGATMVNNEQNTLTLVLKKDGDSYSGTLSDSMGMADQAPLQKVKLEKDSLSFYFILFPGSQDTRIDVAIKVTEAKLLGTWTTEAGDSGAFELQRKKQ
jgi:hypothetical protein